MIIIQECMKNNEIEIYSSDISQLPLTLTEQNPGFDLWRSVVSQPQLSSSPAAQLCQEAGRDRDIIDIILVTDQGQQKMSWWRHGSCTDRENIRWGMRCAKKEMKWILLRTEMQHFAAEYCSSYWSNLQDWIDSIKTKTLIQKECYLSLLLISIHFVS